VNEQYIGKLIPMVTYHAY